MGIIVTPLSEVEPREAEWLWTNRIPRNELTLIQGDPGVGKSFFIAAVVAALTSGQPLPGMSDFKPIGNVILFSEGHPNIEIRPSMERMGADLDKVLLQTGFITSEGKERMFALDRMEEVKILIDKLRPDLVVIDPLINYMSTTNTNQAFMVNQVLTPLKRLATEYNFGLVANMHCNKSDVKAIYKGQGSIQFLATARSSFFVAYDPSDATKSERVACHVKSNLSKLVPSVNFTISDDKQVIWGVEGKWSADQLLLEEFPDIESMFEFAKGYAIGFADGKGAEVLALEELRAAAKARGIGDKTLQRARRELGMGQFKGVVVPRPEED